MLKKLTEILISNLPVNGIEFIEEAHGTHRFVERRRDRGEMPFAFSFHAKTDSLKEVLHPEYRDFPRLDIEGTISMKGVTEDVPMKGNVEISFFRKRQIVYNFDFKARGGITYHFHGHKDLSVFQLLKSITTLYGEVVNTKTGKMISTTVSFLDFRDLPKVLKSIKLR